MLPVSLHPLSPPADEPPPRPVLSPSPTLPSSLLHEVSSPSRPPLFPSESTPPSAFPDSYFAPRTASPDDLRPPLVSNLTIRAPMSLLSSPEDDDDDAPPATLHPLKSVSLPMPPHKLPPSSPLLRGMTPSLLVAIVQALSRELEAARLEADRKRVEADALAKVLKDQGVGDGEVERTRVRARAGVVTDARDREWRIELASVAVEVGESASRDDGDEPSENLKPSEIEQPVLNLDDLAEAISENAFSFASVEYATPLPDEGIRALPHSLDDPLLPPSPDSTSPSEDGRSTPSLPTRNGPTLKPTRQRHASLSSRIFSTFSLGGPVSVSPPSAASPGLTASSSSSSLTVPSSNPTSPPPTSSALTTKPTGRRKHKRAGSITSVSSVASGASVASDSASAERKEAAGFGDWLAWRSWTKSREKDEAKRTHLAVENTDGSEAAETNSIVEEDEDATVAVPDGFGLHLGGRPRGDSSATSFSDVSVRASHRQEATSSDANGGLSSSVPSLRSPSTATRSSIHASDAPSSPTSSMSPPSSSTPDSKARTTRPQNGDSLVSSGGRVRGTSMPLLVAQHVPASPTLSTPTPTSTLSTQPLSTPHLSRTLSQAHRGRRSRSDPRDPIVHPSHFTAIALAAGRKMAGSRPGLFRHHSVGEQVRGLAHDLLGNIASSTSASGPPLSVSVDVDDNDSTAEPTIKGGPPLLGAPKLPTFLSVPVPLYSADASTAATKPKERGYVSSAKGTIGRALGLGASASANLTMGGVRVVSDAHPKSPGGSEPNVTMFPKLSNLSRYSPFAQPALSTPSTHVSLSSHALPIVPHPPTLPLTSAPTTMELDTISGEAAPPTLALHNPATGRMAGAEDEGPMVDRYGFVYDIRSGMKLLRESRRRQERAAKGVDAVDHPDDDDDSLRHAASLIDEASAPPPITEEEQIQVEVEAELEALREALGLPPSTGTSPTLPRSPVPRLGRVPEETQSLSTGSLLDLDVASPPPLSRSSSPQPPPRPTRLVRSTSSDVNHSHSPPGGHQSMKRLLGQLTDMHDAVEKTQKEAWEGFIGRRQAKLRHSTVTSEGGPQRRGKRQSGALNLLASEDDGDEDEGWSENLVGVAQMGVAGKSGKEDWLEFKSLVRKGVPIAFRPKIWAECSGANEAREPGLYQELLAQHNGDENKCLNQIDMDCHRTFPTNVFFAGTGPGVAKLRNVLIAYSWRNPTIGYCQGMNNLTATLLLTHPAEEDAFWVLVCMIEKILPSDYYTSHLLVSQADQRVLRDLVERHMPELSAHLEDLGVELPAITFGWFLSLFTDALPIQTLLRVWDLLFVFGTVILFRVAIGILQMNQAEIMACDSAATLYSLMRTLTTHLYQVDRLLKIACEDLRTVVKDRDVSILRNRHVQELMQEMNLSPDEDDDFVG